MMTLGGVGIAAFGVLFAMGQLSTQQAIALLSACAAAALVGAILFVWDGKRDQTTQTAVFGDGDGPQAGGDMRPSGDAVGRDKIGGDKVGRDKITTIVGPSASSRSPVLQVLTRPGGMLRRKGDQLEAFFRSVSVRNRDPDGVLFVDMVLAYKCPGGEKTIPARRFSSLYGMPLGEAGTPGKEEVTGNAIFPMEEEYEGRCEIRLLDESGKTIACTQTKIEGWVDDS